MDMSTVDDDDFWADEDFIATIENVVKKAEEASAARHGGTQTQLAAALHASAIGPPQPNRFRAGELGHSPHGTPHVSEFVVSRPNEGSIGSCGIHGGTMSGCREHPLPLLSVFSPIVTPEPLRKQEASSLSRSQQGRPSVQGPRQSQEASVSVPFPRGDVGQQMAEKDGMIYLLRCHVEEAEQQLGELRERFGPQNVSSASLHQQQLELERLSAQLLFKEHEIIEGQRARAEKEQRLEDALAETAALKIELRKLKIPRQVGAELERRRNYEVVDAVEHTWPPSWMPERISEAVGKASYRLQDGCLEGARDVDECVILHDEFPNDVRTGGIGGVSLDGKDCRKFVKSDARDTHNIDLAGGADVSTSERPAGEENPSAHQLNSLSKAKELSYSLQHLWGLKGVGNDGIFLLSKLYATCRQDLYSLFSCRESRSAKNLKGSERGKEERTKGGAILEKLHIALAKVANGSAQPKCIVSPLLELCKLDNVSLVGSALHVLRCILQHDSPCRRNLLLRGSQQGVSCQVQTISSSSSKKTSEGEGWCLEEDLNLPVKWMLQLALTSSSARVKFEALANIGVLVMNSEPFSERLMFGPLLYHGAMDLLLKMSIAEIQLQAVKIVHLLLHCPTIIRRFCVQDYSDENKVNLSKVINDGDARRSPLLEKQTPKLFVDSHDEGNIAGQTLAKPKMAVYTRKHSSDTELSKRNLLDGLTQCLKPNDKTSQGIALHRSVIRLLSFLEAFGESGAAMLMQAGSACDDPVVKKACKDNTKMKGVVVGEDTCGQLLVGDGSASTHCKGRDLGNKGNGIPIIVVDERINSSERPQNISQGLLTLIDFELDLEEREEWVGPCISDDRDHLVDEAITLLCRLSSDSVQAPVVIGHLVSSKDMASLTLNVTNRLVSRSHLEQSWDGQRPAGTAELARVLRERVLRSIEDISPFPSTDD